MRLRTYFLIAAVYCLVYLGMQHNLAHQTMVSAQTPISIIIDAGHGGEDGGTVSREGVRESEINLSISHKLDYILAFCGMRTVMIRTDDSAVHAEGASVRERKVSDLKNRVNLVNGIDPAVLISIHQNHFAEPKYHGAQVFYSASGGSKELASGIQNTLRTALDPANQRLCKPADTVYLLEQCRCTGVLIECGFLSNPQEAQLLQTQDYQKKIVCAIAGGLAQFLEEGKRNEI